MAKPRTLRPLTAGIRLAYPITPTTPGLADMKKCFYPLDRLIADLKRGEVSYARGVPVMRDSEHSESYGEIEPSLAGWCSTFDRMAEALGIPLDLGHMRRLAKRLAHGMLIDQADIARFIKQVDRCRSIYLACPNTIRQRAYTAECIGMALDDLGLREAA